MKLFSIEFIQWRIQIFFKHLQKSITNLFVTSTVTRSCQSVCVPVTTQVFNTQCCQADLCNHAFSVMKSFPRALVFTLMVVLGKYIVVWALWMFGVWGFLLSNLMPETLEFLFLLEKNKVLKNFLWKLLNITI